MTLFEIVAFYLALNLVLLVLFSAGVIRQRIRNKVSLGHGEIDDLLRATRAQANFTEYVPIAFVGLLVMASLNASPLILHTMGILLTLGRILHAIGITRGLRAVPARRLGMVLTFVVLLYEAGFLLYNAVF